jgi:TolB-like protein/Flp pilus assembly protein TadD
MVDAIWGGRAISDSSLSTRINAARVAIGDNGRDQSLIKTLARKGVRFVGDVHEGADASPPRERAAPAPVVPWEKPSIAVLPFDNLSADAGQDFFADGMTEEVITALARCRWLLVVARNSSFAYRGKHIDVRQLGRDLGVRYVLQGSVRRADTHLRFSGLLLDAESGRHIWAERFDGELTDLFDLQDRLTSSLVAAIEPRIQLAEIERLSRRPARSFTAYELYLRALQRHYEFTEEGIAAALSLLLEALKLDPTYAPAMALAAHCTAERRNQGWAMSSATEETEALMLASRAVELARDDANVAWMAAWTHWIVGHDNLRARELVTRSIEINANSSAALALAAWIEVTSGNSDRAFALIEQARRLNPRDPREWFVLTVMAAACVAAGRFDEAVIWAKRALYLNPRFSTALRLLAASLAKLWDAQRAQEALRKVYEIEPGLTLSSLRERMAYMEPRVWDVYADGLRKAGVLE